MGGFLSWLNDQTNDIYDSYIEPSFTTLYDAADDYLPALLRGNYYKPKENDLQPISGGQVPGPEAPPARNSIPNIDAPKTSFIGDFWEGLKKGSSAELEHNPLSPQNLGKAIAVPKQGLDYLGALDPLGIADGSRVKLDEDYKPVSPTLGQQVGPMLLPHRVGESPDDANPFLRRASETVTDFMADPSLAAMTLPGIAKILLPGIVEGTAEEAGNLWSMLGDQGKNITDVDVQEGLGSFIPSLVMAGQAAHGTMKEAPHLAKGIPEFNIGGGYSSRSPIDLSVPDGRRQIPNFASAMAESSEAPKGILEELFAAAESDPLLKRRDELKALGVLVNPTGRVPKTESLYHGTGEAWAAESLWPKPETPIDFAELTQDIHEGKYKVGDILPSGDILSAINPDGSVDVQPQTFPMPEGRELNPFSSRKASSSNLHGGPFYFTEAAPVAEGAYSVAGEGQGSRPELINADVTTNKSWNLDAPIPRDIRVKGLTLLQKLINQEKGTKAPEHLQRSYDRTLESILKSKPELAGVEEGSFDTRWLELSRLLQEVNSDFGAGRPVLDPSAQQRLNYYTEAYNRLKQAQTGRDVESIMSDVAERSGSYLGKGYDSSGLHISRDKYGMLVLSVPNELPLRQRLNLSGKDRFLRVLESDLGYDSVKHSSKFTGGEVTIPFSRTQIKSKGAQKLTPLSERSLEALVNEYESLDPTKKVSEQLISALEQELFSRQANLPSSKQLEGWRQDPKGRQDLIANLEERLARRDAWEKTDRKKYDSLKTTRDKWLEETKFSRDDGRERPVWDLSKADREFLTAQDDYIASDDWILFPEAERRTLEAAKEFNPETYDRLKAIVEKKFKYSPKEPELTPEDQALLAEPVIPQSLKNPTTRIKESKTPETTDIAEWISDEPKPIPVGEWVDKAARTLGYQDLPGVSRIQGEALDPASKFIISQKKKYGKDWEAKQTPEEAAFLKKLETAPEQATYEKIEPKKLSEPSEDPDIRAIQESLLAKPVTPAEEPMLSPGASAKLEQIEKGRPKKKQVDIAGESTEKQDFLVSLSNGKSYKIRATDEVNAQEIVQDKLDSIPENKFSITGVKRKYSALESDIRTQAAPRETQLTDKLAGETVKEEIKAKTAEEKLKEKAQVQELKDQLKVERQKAKAGDREAKLREKAIEKELRDKLKVEEDYKKAEAKRKQAEYQAKLASETGWRNSPPVKILNSAKSIAFGGDIGHLLRQGKQINVDLLFSRHAKKVVEQFPVIFKAAKSEKWFTDYHAKLASNPIIKLLTEKFGLDMPGIGKGLKEEVFHGEGYAEKIPGFGKFFAKPSERAYTAGMNFLRAAEAIKLVDSLKKQGKTPENSPEAYRGVARAINILTQRGDFSARFSKQLADASFAFGAPRAKVARIQNLVELAKGGTSGDIVRKTAAKMMVFNLGMMALLQATRKDGEFVTDPSRTDFGKFRDGNLTVDPFVGLGTTARTAIQTIRAVGGEKAKSPHSGREYVMGPVDPVIKEISNMTAPGIRAAWILMTGRDLGTFITGKPAGGYLVDRSEALSQVLPLSAKQIKEILDSPGGEEKILYSAMQIAGEGVDIFDYKKAQETQARLKKERGLKTKPKSSSKKRAYSF